MQQHLSAQLTAMAQRFGDRIGFVDLDSGERLRFDSWEERSNRLARGLRRRGVAKGDRVAIDLPVERSVVWVTAYVALHKLGAVAVPLNTRLSLAERAALLDHSGAVAALSTSARWQELAGPGLAAGVRLVVTADDAAPPGAAAPAGVEWVAIEGLCDPDGSPLAVAVGPEDVADIVYTSGTTGKPKGVVVRHGNASVVPNAVPAWGGGGWMFSSPLFTFAGLTGVYTPMKLGLTALYQPRFDVDRWFDNVERERPVMVFLVPAMAELLTASPRFETADLSSIGLCAVGSAPLSVATWRRLSERLPEAAVSNAYGMTEAGSAYTILPKEEAARRAGSVGRPLPPAEFFVVDEAGERLLPGEVGELVIALPGRPREYFRDPAATAATWRSDGLHTGDLARIDDEGYVWVVGRSKDVVIRGGHNVHSADVEAVLYEHPDVQEAAVTGVPHKVLGEEIAAWVVPVAGRGVDPDELRRWVADRLADYKVPRLVTVVESLPRNASGKVLKARLPSMSSRG